MTGGNGSGKSTFLNVIAGLYCPEKGFIAVDGQSIDFQEIANFQSLISTVFRESFLFCDDRYRAETGLSSVKVQALLEDYGLAELVNYEDGHFHYDGLSAGLSKRLALVVALAEDKPILLLDEWAAEQDPSFRDYFYRKILPALRAAGKTVVAITHDEQYFYLADQILELRQGELVEK